MQGMRMICEAHLLIKHPKNIVPYLELFQELFENACPIWPH